MDLVQLDKRILRFTPPSEHETSQDSLVVTNTAPLALAFKVKTTNQSRYIVRPNLGIIPASSSLTVDISLQPGIPAPAIGVSKDKFLVMVGTYTGETTLPLPDGYWTSREADEDVMGMKIRVEFIEEVGSVVKDIKVKEVVAERQVATARGELYEDVVKRAKELETKLEERNLELARLKKELKETRENVKKVLAETHGGNGKGVWDDPLGGVGIVGILVMAMLAWVLMRLIWKA